MVSFKSDDGFHMTFDPRFLLMSEKNKYSKHLCLPPLLFRRLSFMVTVNFGFALFFISSAFFSSASVLLNFFMN